MFQNKRNAVIKGIRMTFAREKFHRLQGCAASSRLNFAAIIRFVTDNSNIHEYYIFVSRANRAYWENLEPATGRPHSPALSKFEGPA